MQRMKSEGAKYVGYDLGGYNHPEAKMYQKEAANPPFKIARSNTAKASLCLEICIKTTLSAQLHEIGDHP